MRKILVGAFVSLDGVMQGPGGPEEDMSGGFSLGGWTVPFFDEAGGRAVDRLMREPFDLLLGRKTYDIFAGYWPRDPNADTPIGQRFNGIKKYVASRNPDLALPWQNSVHLGPDPMEAVRRLKEEDGPNLLTQGSADFLQTLLNGDLVDELTVMVFPVVLGAGKRLFTDAIAPSTFALLDSTRTPSGVVVSRYRRQAKGVETGSFA
jgi:dihydrofolate reductase